MRVFFSNLGCKLNQAEIEGLARRFVAAGHELAPALETADLHVINSCTVTQNAARDSRKTARRRHPGLKTVLTGCHASGRPQSEIDAERAELGVDLWVENRDKERLLDLVHQAFPEQVPPALELPVPFVPLDLGHQRALVKIEDGCNMTCAFCIIPTTRGRQQSRSAAEVLAEVEALAAAGFPEIVITGVQISEYRDGKIGLYELVAELLAKTSARRLRLSSIAPWRFDRRLLGLLSDHRLCRHFHLALQSGSDDTLVAMRRPYSSRQFAELVAHLRENVANIAITTDVIVGFPSETEAHFAASLAFVERMSFAKLHAFTYSPRSGTRAASLPDRDGKEKRERVARLIEVGEAGERSFWSSQVGQERDVVWDERRGELWSGLTDNYVRVVADSARAGALERVRLTELTPRGVRIAREASARGGLSRT